jgi:hypothetical protein
MAQVIIRNIDDKVILRLKARAKARGRSLEAELRSILERESRFGTLRDFRDHLIAMHQQQPAQSSDSTELLREDRDR